MDVLYFGLSFLSRWLFPWKHISQQATSSSCWTSFQSSRYILSFYFLRLFYSLPRECQIASMEYNKTAPSTSNHSSHARRYPKPHSSKARSDSSDHDFIYNATKAEPGPDIHFNREEEDNANRQSHLFPGGRELDERLAMLLASLPEMVPTADNPEERMRARLNEGRPKTLSDNWVISKTNDSLGNVFKDAKSKIGDLRRWGRGRVISFSEADSGTKRPRWVLNLMSPVQPFLPKYPPPERSLTPPGLPTFGTPEAIDYTTQFDVRSSLPNRDGPIRQSSTSRASSKRATESYSHMLRRIVGLPSSSSSTEAPTSQMDRRHGCTVARAEDGTAVLGRFPYRTSGHGTNLNRNLEYHPFHQDPSGVASLDDRHRSRRHSRSEHHHTTTRRARNSIQHATRFSRPRFSTALPSVPEPAASSAHSPVPSPASMPSAYMPEPNSPTMLTYDGEGGNGAYTSTSPIQSSPADTGAYNVSRYLWDGYAVLIQYIPCCCVTVPTDDTIPDSVDVFAGSVDDGSVSADFSRPSDETFVTALDWHEPGNRSRFSGLNQFESLRRSMLVIQPGVMERR